jgi:xanthine dehydrogenase accessory factor
MRHLDVQVIDQALQWARAGQAQWLCTVLSTYGSAPRAPGAMLVTNGTSEHVGSLSGGCVEEEFLESLTRGELREPAQIVSYGDSVEQRHRLRLPCGGVLIVLVEHRAASLEWIAHLESLQAALLGQRRLLRHVELSSGALRLDPDTGHGSERVQVVDESVRISVGPALRLILAGLSPVAEFCASFARAIGCEVIACTSRRCGDATRAALDVHCRRRLPRGDRGGGADSRSANR